MPRFLRWLLIAVVALGSLAVVPRWVCGYDGDAWFDGALDSQRALADGVARRVREHDGGAFYRSGSSRFDGQSAVAVHQMTLLGLGQMVLEHPELREVYLPTMRRAAAELVAPATLRYAAEAYGQHGVVQLDPGEGHAYLGYINLGLGMLRMVDANNEHAALHDRITAALAERLFAASNGLIETYPGETWPPDVAAVAGSIGLHARATGIDRAAKLEQWAERFERCAVHASGYLVQRTASGTCKPLDAPRGSGTAVAAYFIAFANPGLAKRLFATIRTVGQRSLLGFAAVREYAPGFSGGGDVNAGPIVLGMSVGATGFGLGAARVHGDREMFVALYRSTQLFGVPVDVDGERRHAVGGLLGDALLLAMLTAGTP